MTIEQAYEKMGADYNGVLTRFMSEALVTRFAGKFLTDPSFDALKTPWPPRMLPPRSAQPTP